VARGREFVPRLGGSDAALEIENTKSIQSFITRPSGRAGGRMQQNRAEHERLYACKGVAVMRDRA
jgi:hypothetical protein